MEAHPAAIQLRYLQTLTEIAVEKNSTIIFPVPVDLLNELIDLTRRRLAPPTPEQNPPQ